MTLVCHCQQGKVSVWPAEALLCNSCYLVGVNNEQRTEMTLPKTKPTDELLKWHLDALA